MTSLDTLHFYYQQSIELIDSLHFADLVTSFMLIFTAEIGDKSQLVCMTLASRYRPVPVLLGAMTAFAILNTLAVLFGTGIKLWLPEFILALIVGLLFALFGIRAFFAEDENNNAEVIIKNHNIFFSTLLLIAVAEFGDKTQLAVVALGSTADPIEIWLGAILALTVTSALGVLAGQTVLKKFALSVLHRFSGILFLILAILALYKAYLSYYNL